MESLKERWRKALKNPFWWIVVFVWGLFAVAMCTAEGQVMSQVGVLIHNNNDKTHWVRLSSDLTGESDLIEVRANEIKDVYLIEDEYLVCETRDKSVYFCRVEKATKGAVWKIRRR